MAAKCSGKDCKKAATYSVHIVSSDGRYFYCEGCKREFAGSLVNVPEDRRKALLREIVIAPPEVDSAS